MGFLKNLLNKIGHFFSDLFNAAEKTWHKLEPAVQDALLHGSAIVKAINDNISATPDFILQFLQKKWPELSEDKIKSGLAAVTNALNIAEGINTDDLPSLIKALQEYLAKQKGKIWAGISHTIASIFAITVAPAGTKFATISSLLEYVYHRFIKGDAVDDTNTDPGPAKQGDSTPDQGNG